MVLAVESSDVLVKQRLITRRTDLTQAALAARGAEHIARLSVACWLCCARRQVERTG